ncbi:MAG: hypothetical protein H0X24_09925 [Ktedonobacterales bacterium]|nr:hypothetical protein [Ktedonobacterales bacterium]
MKTTTHPLITAILAQLHDPDQNDDDDMALLVGLFAELETRDLPIAALAEFMVTPCADSEALWLFANDHLATWEACVAVVSRDPQRVPVEPVVRALQQAYAQSGAEACEDTDDNDAVGGLIELAGHLGARFPLEHLLPLLHDERILIRRRVIEALGMMGAASPLVAMLGDVSAQIRLGALQHLRVLRQLTTDQVQRMSVDPHPRVRQAALAMLAGQPA